MYSENLKIVICLDSFSEQRSVDGLHLQTPMVFKKIKVGQLSYNAQFSFSGLSTL